MIPSFYISVHEYLSGRDNIKLTFRSVQQGKKSDKRCFAALYLDIIGKWKFFDAGLGQYTFSTSHEFDIAFCRRHRRQGIEMGRVAIVPAKVKLADRLGIGASACLFEDNMLAINLSSNYYRSARTAETFLS